MTKSAILFILAMAGCSRTSAPPLPYTPPPPVKEVLDDRRTSCSNLYEHMVDLTTMAYIKENLDKKPPPSELEMIRSKIHQTLVSKGLTEIFGFHCMLEMSKQNIECISKARTLAYAQACESE